MQLLLLATVSLVYMWLLQCVKCALVRGYGHSKSLAEPSGLFSHSHK
jgi:hypothetical protein